MPANEKPSVDSGSVRAVERALILLEELSLRRDGATASELARATRLSVSTAHRLLLTLQGRGFVRCDAQSLRWHIGRAAFSVGSAFAPQKNLSEVAFPVMRELALSGRETVNLGKFENGSVVFLARFDPHTRACSVPAPLNLPAHCSSIGKALLASDAKPPLSDLARSAHLPGLTNKSIRVPAELARQLDAARATGFAVDDEENTIGLRCVAAPIFDERSRPIAAVSIAAPVERLPAETFPSAGSVVRAAAQRISAALGGGAPR